MNSDWIGKVVSVNCGGLGFYQGTIEVVQLDEQTIGLKNPIQNGRPCQMPLVTLSARDIKELNFLDVLPRDASGSAISTSAPKSTVVVAKRKQRPVAEHLALSSSNLNTSGANSAFATSSVKGKPHTPSASFSPALAVRASPRKGQGGDYRATPTRRERERLRDEDCFRAIDEEEMGKDFDFEKNLALFNKKSEFDAIDDEIAQSNQPDVIRLIDCNQRPDKKKPKAFPSSSEPKYRNDENVLVSLPAQFRPIDTGEEPPPGEYVTDSGLVVPAVSLELRQRLEHVMESKGLSMERISELVARSAVELALQLLGGAHRLNPNNSHQVPRCVFLCGVGRCGVFGLAAARHLASQGVHTHVYVPDLPHWPQHLEKELELYKLTGAKWTRKAKDLPSSTVDVIVCALEDHEMWPQERCQPWLKAALVWAEEKRAPVLAIDPPMADADEPLMPFKVCLTPGLPLWYAEQAFGKIYMTNLAVPTKIYHETGIKFSSPFEAKTVIPLYRVT